ncbi:MAG: hypothetical protein J7K34_02095, partial [Flavobacteriaceae bacterium]|nr:hypothetical protein [Flavobacteriaceae bacterium]
MKKISLLKRIIYLPFFMIFVSNYAQNPMEIIYHKSEKEKGVKPNTTVVFYNDIAYLSNSSDKTFSFIDYKNNVVVDMIKYKGEYYKTLESFDSLPQPVIHNETEIILGYTCKKAVFKAFSNTIEVWYTNKAKVKGSPYKNYLPKNSLVLKIKINGSLRLVATDIHELDKNTELFNPMDDAREITMPELRELQIKSRYVTMSVFKKQQINFDTKLKTSELNSVNKTFRCSNGTVILKRIILPEIAKEGASIFATLTNWSNGDAYDRTCSLFTIKEDKEKSVLDAIEKGLKELPVYKDKNAKEYQGIVSTKDYEVPVELMRFFTSFGVSHFNTKR